MKILAQKNAVTKPRVVLNAGGGSVPVLAATVNLTAGRIPTARVQCPAEFIDSFTTTSDNTVYTIEAGDHGELETIFTGYLSGTYGRGNSEGFLDFGANFVHLARDLDQMRLAAPGIHPGSTSDYTYLMAQGNSHAAGTGGLYIYNSFTFNGGSVLQAVIDAISLRLSQLVSGTFLGVGVPPKVESLGPCIELLSRIKVIGGTFKGGLSNAFIHEIREYFGQIVYNSYSQRMSVWDTMVRAFSSAQSLMICMPDGSIVATPDVAGFEAFDNFILPDQIISFDASSDLSRNIKEVYVCGNYPSSANGGGGVVDAVYGVFPPSGSIGGTGATLSVEVPPFFVPVVKNLAKDAREACTAYAESLYYTERNKMRTFVITTPFAPGVFPGTVAKFFPLSAIKALNDEGSLDALNDSFNGYCHQITHNFDVQARLYTTTFRFSNVSTEGGVSAHPLFSDVEPLSWD